MSKQVKLRRGTTAQHAAFTGALGEVTLDTDKDVTVVHDGVTAGGVPSGREDRARGWTRTEYFTTAGSATYSTTGKTDLKRIRVTCYGGGAGGSNAGGGGGGGSGGIAIRVMDISEITTTVTVTVGAGGGVNSSGGTTSFGAYVSATGGSTGGSNTGGSGGSGNSLIPSGQSAGTNGASGSVIFAYPSVASDASGVSYAMGGVVTQATVGSTLYTFHTFTSSGIFQTLVK